MPRLRIGKFTPDPKPDMGPESVAKHPFDTDEEPIGFPTGEKGLRKP